jgi:hypothetical protein
LDENRKNILEMLVNIRKKKLGKVHQEFKCHSVKNAQFEFLLSQEIML